MGEASASIGTRFFAGWLRGLKLFAEGALFPNLKEKNVLLD